MSEGGRSADERIAFAFRRAVARRPTSAELQVLERGLERYRRNFAADPESAKRLIRQGDSPVDAILDFASSTGITQLFIGHSQRSGWKTRLAGNPVDRLIQRSRGMDIRIFPQ